jgi:hypothetical protein
MNRRDFLRLRTRGRERVLELSCEQLFMRYSDAESGAGRARAAGGVDPDPQSWEGEPPTEIVMPTTSELFEQFERELSSADVLRLMDRDWLDGGVFQREVEARIEAFVARGGRVELEETANKSRAKAAGLRLILALGLGAASSLGACAADVPQGPSDDVLQARVEAAIARASDVPGDSLTISVRGGVVTVTGSVICAECGGRRTPGGSGTVQQSLGAVVRAIPGVQSVEFDLRYRQPVEPPGGAGG